MYTNDESRALALLKTGKNVFLTGGAGVGKSFVINKFREWLNSTGKNHIVCAPTGIAAGNISGATIHSVFHISLCVQTSKIKSSIKENGAEVDELLFRTDVVIIDEISMCRVDVFDAVVLRILKADERRRNNGLKQIQIVLVGDFFQLPPVITDVDRVALEYDTGGDVGLGFAFQSSFWGMFNFYNIELKEVVRQDNKEFVAILNDIRVGRKTGLTDIFYRSNHNFNENAITLCGLNSEADSINYKKLGELPGVETRYDAQYNGDAKENDCIAPKYLRVKLGARVMTLVNKDGYKNGDFGVITGLYSDAIKVRLDNGKDVIVKKFEWEVYNYIIDEYALNKVYPVECGSIVQFPLKLAYAVTIHKSQGQTFDNANINPSCWECGQLYVALSRVRTLQGIYLFREPDYSDIKYSLNVIRFYNNLDFTLPDTLNLNSDTDNTDITAVTNSTDNKNGVNTGTCDSLQVSKCENKNIDDNIEDLMKVIGGLR